MMRKISALFMLASCAAGTLLLSGCGSAGPSNGTVNMEQVSYIRSTVEAGGGAAGGGDAVQGNPTGWATLRGRFRIDSAAPQQPALQMGENKDMCPPARAEQLVVDANGGIRDVLIFLNQEIPDDSGDAEPKWTSALYNLSANAGRPAAELPFAARPVVEFDQKQCRFLDHVFALRVGQKMTILNSDPFGHNTSIKAQNNAGFDKTIPPGASSEYTASASERTPFPVSCAIHPWMSAKMIIRGNPYFAVTKADGTFEIKDVPAGVELEFRVWQEKAGFVEHEQNGEKWSKGKMKLKLEPDEERDLDVVLNVSHFE